jgi:outer membrane protein
MRRVIDGVLVGLCASATVAAQGVATAPVPLTLKTAEQQALDHHPLVRAGHYAELAAGENIREIRSTYFPTAIGSFTGAGAMDGTRIAAGGLNNPTILDRFAAGLSFSQLLTDFGRTGALTESATLTAESRAHDTDARKADVLLQVDRAYFNALRAQAVLNVAEQTVAARALAVDQVTALADSHLKSGLDVSFAKVNASEAQLLLVQATNDLQSAFATLAAALGSTQTVVYALQEEPLPPAPPETSEALVALALERRPDLAAQRVAADASQAFARAEQRLWLPSISLVGAAGMTPYHQIGLTDRYSAAGINVAVPLTNGNLFAARHAEAALRAQAQSETVHDAETRLARDVKIAWLDARTAYQRLDLTHQLLAQASDALELADSRYRLGLGSIVELTQAQLNKTRADLEDAAARYEYQVRAAVLRYQTGELRQP